MMLALITPDDLIVVDDMPGNLEWLQSAVGGYVERVTSPDLDIWCNEDGMSRNLDQNWIGTAIATVLGIPMLSMMVGTVVLAGHNDQREDELLEPLPPAWVGLLDLMAGSREPEPGDFVIWERHMDFDVVSVRSKDHVELIYNAPNQSDALSLARQVREDQEGRLKTPTIWKARAEGGYVKLA